MTKIIIKDADDLAPLLKVLGIKIKVEIETDLDESNCSLVNVQVWNIRNGNLIQIRKLAVLEPIFVEYLKAQDYIHRLLFIMRNRSRFIDARNADVWESAKVFPKMDIGGLTELVGISSINVSYKERNSCVYIASRGNDHCKSLISETTFIISYYFAEAMRRMDSTDDRLHFILKNKSHETDQIWIQSANSNKTIPWRYVVCEDDVK